VQEELKDIETKRVEGVKIRSRATWLEEGEKKETRKIVHYKVGDR
jgi:hypothetical protein